MPMGMTLYYSICSLNGCVFPPLKKFTHVCLPHLKAVSHFLIPRTIYSTLKEP